MWLCLPLALFWSIISTTQAKISDACHGSFLSQTTNILKCPRDRAICITDVTYYQWHIGDVSCPHTINKHVDRRCCRHDTGKCYWAGEAEHVTELQQSCERTRFKDGRCELISKSPQVVRRPCYIDNIDLSTSSSVRSIQYSCVYDGCQRRATPPSKHRIIHRKPAPTITTKTAIAVTSTDAGYSETTTQQYKETRKLTTPVVDLATIRVTSRMTSSNEAIGTDVGAVVGGIFGGLFVCLLLIGAILLKRWFSLKALAKKGTDIPTKERPKIEVIHNYGLSDSIRSNWTNSSFDSTTNSSVHSGRAETRREGDTYSMLMRDRSVFRDDATRFAGSAVKIEPSTNGVYDHVQADPPQLSVFRHNDYDHLAATEGHYSSPRPRDSPSETPQPPSAERKTEYDHLRRHTINRDGSQKYDLLTRNWNEV